MGQMIEIVDCRFRASTQELKSGVVEVVKMAEKSWAGRGVILQGEI